MAALSPVVFAIFRSHEHAMAAKAAMAPALRRLFALTVAVLVVWRLGYHFDFLANSPFAWAPPSDGALYESSARDLLAAWPLGTQPFYLQGGFAYVVALGLALAANPLWLLVVLSLIGVGAAADLARRVMGPLAGWTTLVVTLSLRAPWFYENKLLPACISLSVLNCMLWALYRAQEGKVSMSLALGVCTGFLGLLRAEWLALLPFVVFFAAASGSETQAKLRHLRLRAALAAALGIAFVLALMAWRNATVTGFADLMPTHGGGTSLYIGNNPHANGLWNPGGIFNHARVDREHEKIDAAGSHAASIASDNRSRAKALGRSMREEAIAWIRSHPQDAARLVGRKLWLLTGNDELSQDYDWMGERESTAWSPSWWIPLPMLFGLVFLEFRARRGQVYPPWFWLAIVAIFLVVATNLVFFTSAMHRLLLAAPLALLAGLALTRLVQRTYAPTRGEWTIALLLTAQGFWPRDLGVHPHPVHAYNLSLAHETLFEGLAAYEAIERGLALHPNHRLLQIREYELRCRLGGKLETNEIDSLQDHDDVREAHPDLYSRAVAACHASVPKKSH
jgi:hypothetical protein